MNFSFFPSPHPFGLLTQRRRGAEYRIEEQSTSRLHSKARTISSWKHFWSIVWRSHHGIVPVFIVITRILTRDTRYVGSFLWYTTIYDKKMKCVPLEYVICLMYSKVFHFFEMCYAWHFALLSCSFPQFTMLNCPTLLLEIVHSQQSCTLIEYCICLIYLKVSHLFLMFFYKILSICINYNFILIFFNNYLAGQVFWNFLNFFEKNINFFVPLLSFLKNFLKK